MSYLDDLPACPYDDDLPPGEPTEQLSATGLAALAYARLGWRVFPCHGITDDGHCTCGKPDCHSPGKHPRTPHGCKDATTDPELITTWWRRWPDSNVAVATGAAVIVLDVDAPRGPESLADLEVANGKLPFTVVSQTGGGGVQYLFQPNGKPVPNSAGKLGVNLDTRGAGGYVIMSPSRHASGQLYRWVEGQGPDDVPLAEIPSWIPEQLNGKPQATQPAAAPTARRRDGAIHPWARAALDREISDVNGTAPGGRNQALNRAGFSLFQLVAGGELPRHLVLDELRAACETNGLIADKGLRAFEATVDSAQAAGMASPRRRPADPAGVPSRSVQTSVDDSDPDYHQTELGLAERLVAGHAADIRFCFPWSTWLIWDGQRWARDREGAVLELLKPIVRQLHAEAAQEQDPDQRKALWKYALKCERETVMRAAATLARSSVPVLPEALDVDVWFLNTPTGTVDLRTGEVRPHRREDLLTKLCPTPFDPDATAPTWERFLLEIFDRDVEMCFYLQRLIGYAATGCCREHVMPLLIGKGGEGKSTMTGAVERTFGPDYALSIPPGLLFDTRQKDSHPTGLAALAGKRFAVTHELDSGTRLAEGLVKSATGGDPITARRMRQDFFTFMPTHTIFLAANSRPVVRGTDDGIWRRLRLIPFRVQIPEDRQDTDLPAKLGAEAPGILRWIVQGAQQWLQEGLADPEVVRIATAGYRSDQDTLGDFLDAECIVGDGETCQARGLYERYAAWHRSNLGGEPMNQTTFGRRLTDRGIEPQKLGGQRVRLGVSLR
ncbi:MAG: phage/plasmid primase, P4 family [Planctomycetota bacterium]